MNKLPELSKTHPDLPNGSSAFSLLTEAKRHKLVVKWKDIQAKYP